MSLRAPKPKKQVKMKNVIFGDGKVYIQSMLNCKPEDVNCNIKQALALEEAGCEIIRVALPEKSDVRLIAALKERVTVPIVADIHYDYQIALEAVKAGADKIRINPGNIGSDSKVKMVVDACKSASIPIRVGVNAGSVPKAKTIVQSALEHIALLERFDFDDIVVSVKSSNVRETISAYRELYISCPYPLHIGITEAGTERNGLIKSACAMGGLLIDGIGDTIRVSLTADPLREVEAAKDILKALGLRKGVEVISCPTCGRTKIDVISLAHEVEERLKSLENRVNPNGLTLKIAVMGCAVNGPGECREADFGITGGDGEGLIFSKGEITKKVPENMLIDELIKLIETTCR